MPSLFLLPRDFLTEESGGRYSSMDKTLKFIHLLGKMPGDMMWKLGTGCLSLIHQMRRAKVIIRALRAGGEGQHLLLLLTLCPNPQTLLALSHLSSHDVTWHGVAGWVLKGHRGAGFGLQNVGLERQWVQIHPYSHQTGVPSGPVSSPSLTQTDP